MIKALRHTGLVVHDLDAAIVFYEGMGLTLDQRRTEEGPYIQQVTGIPETVVEWAKLTAGAGAMVELLHYRVPAGEAPMCEAPPNQRGCSHVAFTVMDVEAACARVLELGGTVVSPPVLSPDGRVRVVYGYDKDGILFELVEEQT